MRNFLKMYTLRSLMHRFPRQHYCIYKHMQMIFDPCPSIPCYHRTHQSYFSVLSSPELDMNSNIKLLTKAFPEPKKIIYEVLNEVLLKDETLDLKPSISSEQVLFGSKNEFLWHVTLSMKWPENFVVEGLANKKSEAENIAFLHACQKLKNFGILDDANKAIVPKDNFNINDKRVKTSKMDLLNIFQRIWMRHGKKEYIPKFMNSSIKGMFDTGSLWKSQLHLAYPEKKVFEATAHRLRDADNIAAAKALTWLYDKGVVNKNHRLVLYSKEDEMKLLQSHLAPYSICIPQETLDQMENVFSHLEKQDFQLTYTDNSSDDMIIEELSYNIMNGDMHSKPTEEELHQSNIKLYEKYRLLEKKFESELSEIKNARSSLPIFQKREEILKLIDENQVVVLSGETGCGKSTQVPQFILDHYINQMKGSQCNIIVTQPRRLSSIAIASRVAEERGETVGDTVGYHIRLNKCLPSGTGAILYCTTGMLLRKLCINPNLEGISHVIFDEVHERSIHIDFLMILMQKILQTNKNIKLLLMSASFNTHLFSHYYNRCPVIHVPGKIYPVKEYFLEDLVKDIPSIKTVEQKTATFDAGLMVDVISYINETQPQGAILCFLSGWHDIRMVHSKLLENKKNAAELYISSVHSRLPKEEQLKIFTKPDVGKRKVILATNIAETSITVNDVVYVVNSGLQKGTALDVEIGIASLSVQWITKANVRQRRGRAGRVQPGVCYHLFTRKILMEMEDYPVAEILRTPLESVILNSKLYSPDLKAEDFLSKAIEPPSSASIQNGLLELQTINLLDSDEQLTDLGKVVMLFGTHPRLSVALVYAAFFRCVDPILTVSAILTLEKEPFINTLDDKIQIKRIKEMHDNGLCSDHLALNKIYNTWKSLTEETEPSEYIKKYLLDNESLVRIEQLKELFAEDLYRFGLINDPYAYSDDSSECNANSHHLPSILAVLTAAFYPNVVKIIQGEISHGKLHKDAIIYSLVKGQKAYIQKVSVVSEKKELPSPWLVYFSAMKSEARRLAMMASVSSVPGICLLLLAGKDVSVEMLEDSENNKNCAVLLIDGNKRLKFSCSAKEAHLFLDYREYFQKIFQLYLQHVRNKTAESCEDMRMYQNQILPVTKEILNSPQIPFIKGQMFEFVNNQLETKEL